MKLFLLLLFTFFASFLSAEQWYRSNKGGLALQPIGKAVAMKEAYALKIEDLDPAELIQEYNIESSDKISAEIQYLYDNAVLTLTRKLLRYTGERLCLIETEYRDGLYLLELYDEDGLLIQDRRKSLDGTLFMYEYLYNDESKLLEKKSFILDEQSKLTATERYFYDRTGALRRIDRYAPSEPDTLDANAIQPDLLASFKPEKTHGFFMDTEDAAIQYIRDERGRILAEQRYDENGALISELLYTWQGDRLSLLIQREDSIELKTEYEYDSGGVRTIERNYRNDILERIVYQDGQREVEELYINNDLVLRAVWEDGQKISEEQLDQ